MTMWKKIKLLGAVLVGGAFFVPSLASTVVGEVDGNCFVFGVYTMILGLLLFSAARFAES